MPLTIKTTGFEEYLDPSGGAYVKALVIGSHGAGKTPFGAYWPKPIFADCEHGLMSVAANAVPYAEIKATADMDELIRLLKMDSRLPVEKRKYQTLVVDTVDSYQRRIIQERLGKEQKESLSGWADWGWLDGQMQKLIDAATNLPMNLLVNMHYKNKSVGEGDDRTTEKAARLKGDVAEAIFQDFDLIGFIETYYEAEEGERVLKRHIRWHTEPAYPMIRDRSHTLPRFTQVTFAPSDFQQIFDCLVGGAEGLPESTTLGTYQTAADGHIDTPDEGAGPMAEPALPPAKKAEAPPKERVATIADLMARVGDDPEKAKAMMEWEQTRDGGTAVRPSFITKLQKVIDDAAAPEPTPEPTPEPADEMAAAVAAVEDAGVATAVENTGTIDQPLIMLESALNQIPAPTLARLDHVHSPEGVCLRNTFDTCGVAKPEEGDDHAVAAEAAPLPEDEPLPEPEPEPEPEPVKAEPKTQPAGTTACGDQPPSLAGKFEAKPGCGTVLTPANKDKATLAMVKFKTYLCNDCFAQHAAA